MTRSAVTGTRSSFEVRPTSDHRVAVLVSASPSVFTAQAVACPEHVADPGVCRVAGDHQSLLDRGRGIEAENIARALLGSSRKPGGPRCAGSRRRSRSAGSRGSPFIQGGEEEKESSPSARWRSENDCSAPPPGSGDEPAQSWRRAHAGRRSRRSQTVARSGAGHSRSRIWPRSRAGRRGAAEPRRVAVDAGG